MRKFQTHRKIVSEELCIGRYAIGRQNHLGNKPIRSCSFSAVGRRFGSACPSEVATRILEYHCGSEESPSKPGGLQKSLFHPGLWWPLQLNAPLGESYVLMFAPSSRPFPPAVGGFVKSPRPGYRATGLYVLAPLGGTRLAVEDTYVVSLDPTW
ncbi:hypothetical protein E3N88_18896 [Mikania micrantha]|uniref:Uncharacterized protein n=1 Tax=Mikania micrantha TaxID=192012 RepID=A0A5N6NNB4_9ASTR|nr:hypothetical protein E3N88_18896 [Mikania micrantha]